jgi:hypothetical protein
MRRSTVEMQDELKNSRCKHGIELKDIYVGQRGMVTGSARVAQEARLIPKNGGKTAGNDLDRCGRLAEAKKLLMIRH